MIARVLALVMLLAPAALAQYDAPQGNAHPESKLVDESAAELPNPFGAVDRHAPSGVTTRQRVLDTIAFAQAVDLDALRALAVLHNGRVKTMDTLARETVQAITGRSEYREQLPEVEGSGDVDYRFDPLFTMLDLTIRPASYVDRPLLGIGYLPLRKALVNAGMPVPSGATEEQAEQVQRAREGILMTGRVPPLFVGQHLPRIQQAHELDPGWREAFGRLGSALQLWSDLDANYRLVAPESTTDRWHHLSEDYSPGAEARALALEFGVAWRAEDAARVTELAGRLAELLPTINSDLYPVGRLKLEQVYNNTNAFEWGMWGYFLALVTLLLAFGTQRRWLMIAGIVLLLLATGMHGFGFTLRCIIAERFAIQNQFESMTGVSLFASLVGLVFMAARRQLLFGAAAAATGFLVLVAATQTGIPGDTIEREAAILNTSVLLKYHVTIVLTSYGLIALGFITSLFYLAAYYLTRGGKMQGTELEAVATAAVVDATGDEPTRTGIRRTLKDLDTATMIVLQLAFWTLGVGILLGAWWADHSWGRWWAFDPKETWALITWIVYLIVIHTRFTAKNRELVTAWLSVVGFFIMLWTYFGVNLLLPGLHAYA